MKRIIRILAVVFLLSPAFLHAGPEEFYQNGLTEYTAGDYTGAIESWLQVSESGFESPELYYNLGNAYYKTGNIPSTILYFEKARKLAPNDEEILFNLKIANLKVIDKTEELPLLLIEKWWENTVSLFHADNWAIFSILLLLFVFIFLALRRFSVRKGFRYFYASLSVVFIFLTLLCFVFSETQRDRLLNEYEAVVFTPMVSVKSSPDEKGMDIFIIHEGTKVEITDHIEDWCEIRLQNGSVGWLKASDIQAI
ncbi:MAG: tetratricopeptide repeat protein [Bacteroidetes bacterium]|nr:tetratricopeptide repeat protein [Bacteroidota bacterium]MBU1720095.1 tetratricopeptide repeat protein [Bacteroidota bacterium]